MTLPELPAWIADLISAVVSGLFILLAAYLLDERRARRDRRLADFRIAANWLGPSSNVSLRNFDLARANLSGKKFVGADLEGTSFRDAKLWGTNFREANLRRANFHSARLVGTLFGSSAALLANFSRAVIRTQADPEGELLSDFRDANLYGANFQRARIEGATFERANLTKADFRGAVLAQCNFIGVKLNGSRWEWVRGIETCVWKDVVIDNLDELPPRLREMIRNQKQVKAD